jgi:hypothetical protein
VPSRSREPSLGHNQTATHRRSLPIILFIWVAISPRMSGSTRAGSARLNAYHGAKRQLIGTTASQVAPAWRKSNGTSGPAATNGSTPPLPKKELQRESKMLLSNLPMDVAEAEVEVGS